MKPTLRSLLAIVLLLLTQIVYGQEVSLPRPVPDGLDGEMARHLKRDYQKLIRRSANLQARIDDFRPRCTGIKPSETARVKECTKLKTVIEEQWQIFEDDKDAYEVSLRRETKSSINELEAQIRKLRDLINRDKEQIRRLGFESSVQELEGWTRVAVEGKARIEDKVFKESISAIFGANELALKSRAASRIKTLNPWNDDRLIKEIRSVGIDDPFLEEAIRKLAHTRGKPEMFEALKAYNEALKRTWEMHCIGREMVKTPGNLEPVAQAMRCEAPAVSQG